MVTTDAKGTPGRRVARFLAGAVSAAALGYLAFILLFFGVVTASGCFIECGEPDLVIGVPLLAGAAAAAAAGVTALVWGVVGGPLRRLRLLFWGMAGLAAVILVVGALIS